MPLGVSRGRVLIEVVEEAGQAPGMLVFVEMLCKAAAELIQAGAGLSV